MRTGDALAVVNQNATLHDVLFSITRAGAGAACIVDDKEKLVGFITDGDIRRGLLKDDAALSHKASEVMSHNPMTITPDRLAAEGPKLMDNGTRQIGEIAVVDEDGRPIGILMLKDLLRAGIF
jgi:arabinose-5-phosphate isomerase